MKFWPGHVVIQTNGINRGGQRMLYKQQYEPQLSQTAKWPWPTPSQNERSSIYDERADDNGGKYWHRLLPRL